MVEGATQDCTPPLCVRATLGLGRPLVPGPGRDPGLGLGLSVGLVLAHGSARAPHHTLRIQQLQHVMTKMAVGGGVTMTTDGGAAVCRCREPRAGVICVRTQVWRS
jgi:hypothetical protein